VVAFKQSRSIEAAVASLMEAISPPLLPRVVDAVILMKCSGASEIWNISASMRAPSGLSPESGIKHVIGLTCAGETVYEIYEVNGRPIISNARELRERIEEAKEAIEEILRGSGARNARLEALWLDKAVIRVAGKGRRGLKDLERRIMEELGIMAEFRA
jgi:predicted PilT family ATPase